MGGGVGQRAHDLVLPSLPGYGLSDELTEVGLNVGYISQAWAEMMQRVG